MDSATKIRAICWTTAVVVIGLYVGVRASHRDLDRTFEWDELTTLRYFTWAGVEPTGEPRPLAHIDEIRGLDRPGPREFGIGLYCSLGRWPEPGNHVVHSVLSNLTLGLFGPSEASLRSAALGGAFAFGLSLAWLLIETFRWRFAAPLALILALWNPFVWRYSVTARGYTWLFALQVLLLVWLLRLPRRPAAILATTMAVATAVLCFMNHITMAAYWVLPVYAAFWVLAPDSSGRSGALTAAERSAWRRNLLIQVLIIAALAGLFIVDRLPYIYASSGGAEIDRGGGVRSLPGIAQGIGSNLFPGVMWKVVAICGLLGLLLAPRHSARRTILAIAVIGGAVGVAHYVLSGRTPPARILAWMIPVVLIGVAGLVDGLVRWLPSPRIRIWASLASVAVGVVIAGIGFKGLSSSTAVAGLVRTLGEQVQAENGRTVVLFDKRVGPMVPLYLPQSWDGIERPPAEGAARLLIALRETPWYGRKLATRNQSHVVDPWEPLGWPEVEELEISGDYHLFESGGRVTTFPDEAQHPRGLVFWYPAVDSVAVRPQGVLQHLEDFSLRYMVVKVPFWAKMEVFFRLGCLVFPADSPGELAEIEKAVTAGLERFGGEVRMFVPGPADP